MIPRFSINLNIFELIKTYFLKYNVNDFEKKFASIFKLKNPISFSYGRSAIFCFLKGMNIKGKNVIMPSYTCSVVAHAVVKSGNLPFFVDVAKDTFNFNVNKLKEVINEKTGCIILTNTFGIAQDAKKMTKIIKNMEKKFKSKIYLIQDCCHSFDAKFNNDNITNYGDMVLFSFNISKTITSIFGSIATFKNIKNYNKIKNFRDKYFRKKNHWEIFKRHIYIILASIFMSKNLYFFTYFLQKKTKLLNSLTDRYHKDEKIIFPADYNTLLCNIEAKIGIFQLSKYKTIKQNKIKYSKYYTNILKNFSSIKIPKFSLGTTYSHFPVIVKNKKKIIKSFEKIGYELGEVIEYSIPNLKCYKSKKKFPNSDFLSQHVINIPNYIKIPRKHLELLK